MGTGGGYEQLQIGVDTADGGMAWFRNLDDTYRVQVGTLVNVDEFEPVLNLSPGRPNLVELESPEIYAQEVGGPVRLEFWILTA